MSTTKQHLRPPQVDSSDIAPWIQFMYYMSWRTVVVRPQNSQFQALHEAAKLWALEVCEAPNYRLADWPILEEVEFFVFYCISPQSQRRRLYPKDHLYVFCRGNKAFNLCHFSRDDLNQVCSLSRHSPEAFGWPRVANQLLKDVVAYNRPALVA